MLQPGSEAHRPVLRLELDFLTPDSTLLCYGDSLPFASLPLPFSVLLASFLQPSSPVHLKSLLAPFAEQVLSCQHAGSIWQAILALVRIAPVSRWVVLSHRVSPLPVEQGTGVCVRQCGQRYAEACQDTKARTSFSSFRAWLSRHPQFPTDLGHSAFFLLHRRCIRQDSHCLKGQSDTEN